MPQIATESLKANAESEDGYIEYSIDLVQWFISDASVEAAVKRKEKSRGEAGKGLLKALSAAARILFFPAGAGVLEAHSVLSAAVVRPHAKAKKVEAHASVEVMLSLHDLSENLLPGTNNILGAPLPILDIFRGLYISVLSSLRMQDLIRSSFTEVSTDLYVGIHCDATKGGQWATLQPFDSWCPREGFLGRMSWLSEFVARYKGKHFFVEGFKFPFKPPRRTKGNLLARLSDVTSSGQAITGAQLDEIWDLALTMMDFMPQRARSICGLTGHAPRHALSEVAMACGMHLSERNLLGRWAPTQIEEGGPRVSQASSKHAMPNVYAAGNATLQRWNLTIAQK